MDELVDEVVEKGPSNPGYFIGRDGQPIDTYRRHT